MKRFLIHNQISKLSFAVEAEEMPPIQPEWGKPERWVYAEDLEREGLDQSKAISVDVQTDLDQPDEALRTRTRYKFAADYQVTIEDMTAEIEAKKAKKDAALARLAQIETYKGKTLKAADLLVIMPLMIADYIEWKKGEA